MDWLLTGSLLLIEILLVMKLDEKDFNSRAWTLGVGSALMVVTGDLTPRRGREVFVDGVLFVHCLRAPCRTCCGYQERTEPSHCKQDLHGAGHDMHQLMHPPDRLLVSSVPS